MSSHGEASVPNFAPKIKESRNLNIIDDHTIEVSISEDSDINSLIQDLSIKGIKVKSLKNKTSRLEELFMRLVDKNGK